MTIKLLFTVLLSILSQIAIANDSTGHVEGSLSLSDNYQSNSNSGDWKLIYNGYTNSVNVSNTYKEIRVYSDSGEATFINNGQVHIGIASHSSNGCSNGNSPTRLIYENYRVYAQADCGHALKTMYIRKIYGKE